MDCIVFCVASRVRTLVIVGETNRSSIDTRPNQCQQPKQDCLFLFPRAVRLNECSENSNKVPGT
jgi:hypothetical protein